MAPGLRRAALVERLRDALGSTAVVLHDEALDVGGLVVYGSAWQPQYTKTGFHAGAAVFARWAPLRRRKDVDVLVTHSPPYGTGDQGGPTGARGCVGVADAAKLVRPALHLCGHLHAGRGVFDAPYESRTGEPALVANLAAAGGHGEPLVDTRAKVFDCTPGGGCVHVAVP